MAERLKPEAVFQKFLEFRQGLGMEVLPTTGGPHPFGVMAQRLRAGKLVCLVADRDLSDTGVEVDFFGEKALMPAGPASLAIQTGAALMPVACWFEGEDEWGAYIHDEIPVPADGNRKEKVAAMTQQMADRLRAGRSGSTRRTGTCCSGCSSPTSTRSAWPAAATAPSATAAAHRPRPHRHPHAAPPPPATRPGPPTEAPPPPRNGVSP